MSKINKEKQAAMPQKLLHELLDYDGLTGKWKWIKTGSGRNPNREAGSVQKDGYVQIQIDGYRYLAHRLAWTYIHGDYPNGEQPFVDHINGKKDDNRIENLRVSSHGENQRNQKMHSRNKSGVTGVNRQKKERPSGKIDDYWVANWHDENGKNRDKTFNIEKLGEHRAKQAAIEYRNEQLSLLELNFGIIYSNRHGI